MRAESPWHEERQNTLRERVKTTPGLNVKTYKKTAEICDFIKQVYIVFSCPTRVLYADMYSLTGFKIT